MLISRRLFLGGFTVPSGIAATRRAKPGAQGSAQRQWSPNWISGQPEHHLSPDAPVALQPLAEQVRQIETTFDYLGQPFSTDERRRIDAVLASSDENAAVAELQQILDRHSLVTVTIDNESRVRVERGAAPANLVQDGTRLFLVKVQNQAGVTAPLEVESPNSRPVYFSAWKDQSPNPKEHITVEEIRNRWADISLYKRQPFTNHLSGLPLEYAILEIYSRDEGQRSATVSFNVGQGSQDIGFRNDVAILFNSTPARSIALQVIDENGVPTTASFLFRDRLGAIYPNPSKRLAPDFFFQPQVYRTDGEAIRLPEGGFEVACTGGPEFIADIRKFDVTGDAPRKMLFQLKRWIDPSRHGWYSGDHHIHAAGCSHYVTPSEGVDPVVMMRQVKGEHLNVGCVLNWAPCYYHQEQFFTGRDNPLSSPETILHYDLEISGFPSSHCGHLVLLGLKEQHYPGAERIVDWPTWNLPILQWAKAQGAAVGYPHSGWGLMVKSAELPNYEMPAFDGIGANEFIVDVTHPGAVDFMSAGDTPHIWELNIWYHTLNVGFRARLSGETDFPCITDSRVGQGRVYARIDGRLTYRNWLEALQKGSSYVSDGKSHLMDFTVNGTRIGMNNSEVQVSEPGRVHITVQAAAYLENVPRPEIRDLPYDKAPYWSIERARIGDSRTVPVELVLNGKPVARKAFLADGSLQTLEFETSIEESAWMALRILPSSHTNPMFLIVGRRLMRPLRASAQWCLEAVDQCWTQKAVQISASELPQARKSYDHARESYRRLITEAGGAG